MKDNYTLFVSRTKELSAYLNSIIYHQFSSSIPYYHCHLYYHCHHY